ncbi:MAG: Ig-like domain repeat protein [Terracidiphilus sp.]|jgi:sugar lactone lactonase YvrE
MAIESTVMFRRVARTACLVLVASLLPSVAAKAQLPIKAPAQVTVGSVVPFNHGGTGNWIQIYSMKQDPLYGHILFLDEAGSVIYDMAPGASLPTEIVGPEPSNKDASDCSLLEFKGSYWNGAIAFDKWDNLYVGDRYGSAVQFCRVPYNASAGTWTFSNADIWAGPTYTNSSGQTSSIPPQDLQVGDDGVTFYVSTSDTQQIFKYQVNQAGQVVANSVTLLASGLEAYASQIAVDHAGNLYFVENQGSYPNNVHGIREIPAGSPSIVGDGTGTAESALKRIDQGGWNGINGMYIDPQGNMYFGSTNNISYGGQADGVFMIPNEGTPSTPDLNWADTQMVSPVDGGYPPMVDKRGFVWIATSYYNNWAPAGVNGPACDTTTQQTATATCLYSTIVMWKPGALGMGTSPVGGPSSVPITAFAVPAGGGTVTLTAKNSFTENEVVTISAKSGDALYPLNGLSFYVSGPGSTGTTAPSSTAFSISSSVLAAGASGSTSATASVNQTQALYYMFNQPTTPTSIALAQPSNTNFTPVANAPQLDNPPPTNPVEPCTAGTSYPAFSANMTTTSSYSWCPYYVQLNTTKAGPVEGEVQLLGSGNAVIPGSNAYLSGTGQGAAVSVVSSATIQSIASGLNEPKQVASDLYGNTYVADAALKAIEQYPSGTTTPTSGKVIGSGLSAPSGVAVDGVGNLYIGDSGNIYLVPFVNGALATAQQTKIASGLGAGNLNLAVDGEGDLFVADEAGKQVVEIPNPQTEIIAQNYPPIVLGSGFTGPSAIATDSSGNAWVADGSNLWEISLPFGGSTKVASGLQSPVTGLAVDPSGSVFAAESNGLVWIPYSTTTGALNPNSEILLTSGLGSGPAIPWGVALDGTQNAYASFGSGSTAGLAQLGIGGTYNFNAGGVEVNPNVPVEVDAQILNVGNTPLTVSDDPTIDLVSGTDASDYIVAPATENSPACSATMNTPPGGSCYLGMVLQAPAAGQTSASIAVITNAVNATSGVNIAVSGDVIQDLRPTATAAIAVTPVIGTGCAGATYPGCNTIQVTVSAGAGFGTPTGTVTLSVGSATGNQPKQTQILNSAGVATFAYNALLGGIYTVNADYSGSGTAGATQNTCSTATPCFSGAAAKGTFTIARALPTITLGVPVTNSQCLNYTTLTSGTASPNCAANPGLVTVWAGNTYVYWTKPVYASAIVSSSVGTPSGTVTFTQNGNPADPTQGVNGAIAPNGNGVATFLLQNLGLGVYNLSASYSGDVNFAPVNVPLQTFYVINPSVQITVSGGATITPGTPVQVTLTLMPLVGFSENVSLECNSSDAPIKLAATTPATTLPQYSECTFNYANPSTGTEAVGASGAVPTTIVMTISTDVAVNGGTTASVTRQSPWALAGLFGLGLVGLITGRKKLYRSMAVICIAMMLSGLFMGITACTNAGYSTPPPAPKVTTPNGTYNVQIITYDPEALIQNSLTTPMFTLPVTVQ